MQYVLVHNNSDVLNWLTLSNGIIININPTFTGSLNQCWNYISDNNLYLNPLLNFPDKTPDPIVPQEVTRRQLFLAVYAFNSGLTRAALRSSINNEAGLIEFDEALSFKREHPLVLSLGSQLGLTSGQIDQIFITASGI